MRKLTATGQPFGEAKDDFDKAVDEVMKVASELGINEQVVREAMRPI